MYFPSWFLNASRWRLVPKVCGCHLAMVSIVLLEQNSELSILDFVHTFSTSSSTSILPLLPVCFSLRRQRILKLSQRASKKNMTAKNLSTSNTHKLQTAHQMYLPKNWQERKITHFASNPLFLSAGSRLSFIALLSDFQKSTNWHDWGCSFGSTLGTECFDLLFLLWVSVNI